MEKELCDTKHKAVEEKLDRHEKWIGEHEKKIDTLERSDATNTTQIENLVKSIGGQTKAIWGLVTAILLLLAGFFIWYIQTL